MMVDHDDCGNDENDGAVLMVMMMLAIIIYGKYPFGNTLLGKYTYMRHT